MARITFKEGYGDQLIRGTFGGLVYKVIAGKQHVFMQPLPFVITANSTPAQRQANRRAKVIQHAVANIQRILYNEAEEQNAATVQALCDRYKELYEQVQYAYEKLRDHFPDDNNLHKAIVYYWRTKNIPNLLDLREDEPRMEGELPQDN